MYLLQTDEFLRLAINAIHMDLISRNESFQCLGLTFVGNSESATWLLGTSAAECSTATGGVMLCAPVRLSQPMRCGSKHGLKQACSSVAFILMPHVPRYPC